MNWEQKCSDCEKFVKVKSISTSGYNYLTLELELECGHYESYRFEVDL